MYSRRPEAIRSNIRTSSSFIPRQRGRSSSPLFPFSFFFSPFLPLLFLPLFGAAGGRRASEGSRRASHTRKRRVVIDLRVVDESEMSGPMQGAVDAVKGTIAAVKSGGALEVGGDARLLTAAAAAAAGAAALVVIAKGSIYLFKGKDQSFWGRFGFLDK